MYFSNVPFSLSIITYPSSVSLISIPSGELTFCANLLKVSSPTHHSIFPSSVYFIIAPPICFAVSISIFLPSFVSSAGMLIFPIYPINATYPFATSFCPIIEPTSVLPEFLAHSTFPSALYFTIIPSFPLNSIFSPDTVSSSLNITVSSIDTPVIMISPFFVMVYPIISNFIF